MVKLNMLVLLVGACAVAVSANKLPPKQHHGHGHGHGHGHWEPEPEYGFELCPCPIGHGGFEPVLAPMPVRQAGHFIPVKGHFAGHNHPTAGTFRGFPKKKAGFLEVNDHEDSSRFNNELGIEANKMEFQSRNNLVEAEKDRKKHTELDAKKSKDEFDNEKTVVNSRTKGKRDEESLHLDSGDEEHTRVGASQNEVTGKGSSIKIGKRHGFERNHKNSNAEAGAVEIEG